MKKLIDYGGDKKNYFGISILLILLAVTSEVGVFYLVYKAISTVIIGGITPSTVLSLVGGMAGLYLLKNILFMSGLTCSHIFAYTALANIRQSLAKKLSKLPLGHINAKGSGRYRQNFVDDIENIERLLAHGIPEGLPYVFSCIVVFTMVFIVDWRLGLLSLAHLPIGFFTLSMMIKSGVETNEKYYNSLGKIASTILEYTIGMEVIKIFNKNESSFKKVKDTISNHRQFTEDMYRSNWTYLAIFQSVVPATLIIVLPVGLFMVFKGSLGITELLFVAIMLNSISISLKKVMNFAPVIYNVVTKLDKLEQEFDSHEITQGSEEKVLDNLDISFENISFTYEEEQVLHNVSFDIKEGQSVGIVGESGSGKSTLVKLLMHYWDVGKGSIKLGGININEMPLSQLMDKISFVSQDNFLFNTTIKDNLLLGKADATHDELILACKAAKCHDFIMKLPGGYDTNVGDSGDKLSGGERQRITIARAILKNAPILLLDEMTSYTDVENELKIYEAIKALSENKTVITIAHRLGHIKEMDKIIVINEGKLACEGVHEQILENATYANLWNRYKGSLDFALNISKEV